VAAGSDAFAFATGRDFLGEVLSLSLWKRELAAYPLVVIDLTAALATALEAVAVARELLLAECARPAGPRGEIGHCPADDEAEWAIRKTLLGAFPEWGFLGEETGSQAASGGPGYVWVVDPNDGTTSMQRGYRGHAISVGLVHAGVPVLGVVCAVDAPDDEGDVWAWAQGQGAVRRGRAASLYRAWRDWEVVERGPWLAELRVEDVVGLSQGANRNPVGYGECVGPARFVGLPSIAYRLALVASGECVAAVSLNFLSAWDYAAGHALLRGVGGVLVDEQGREIRYAPDGSWMARRVFGGGPQVVAQLVQRPWQRAAGSGFGAAAPPPNLAPVRARVGRLVHQSGVLGRAQGCLLGQLVGDALGALVEFSSAQTVAREYPDGGPRLLANGGPHRILAGQPTDDSELALMLARSIVARDGFDQEAVAAAYASWFHGWTHADLAEAAESTGATSLCHQWCRPFDAGTTTRQALGAISLAGVREKRAAGRAMAAANRHSQANGALMRISPLGIWGTFREPAEVAQKARQDAELTHPHAVCRDASALFAVTLAAAIRRGLDPQQIYACALDWGRSAGLQSAVVRALEAAQDGPPQDSQSQQGWVLVALQNAFFQLLHTPNLEQGVVATVRAGGDTDTNAAICGALLGAVHGRAAVPAQWQRIVLTCRPMPGWPGVKQPRPAIYWPIDALILAERLLTTTLR
jgi:ADP-ribosyl-[dinitrogen reductase] hydrolase